MSQNQSECQSQSQAQTQNTIIGPDTHLSGTLSFDGGAKILGKIDGKIIGTGDVTIGQQSQCRATIEAKVITIDGTVEGNILAKEHVVLNAGARVTGDILAEALTVAPGASLQGSVRIGATTSSGIIESKSNASSASSTSADLALEEPAGAGTSNWAPAKPVGLGSGLSGLGTPRAAWPNQR